MHRATESYLGGGDENTDVFLDRWPVPVRVGVITSHFVVGSTVPEVGADVQTESAVESIEKDK